MNIFVTFSNKSSKNSNILYLLEEKLNNAFFSANGFKSRVSNLQPTLYMISGNKDAIEANIEYLKNLGEICC